MDASLDLAENQIDFLEYLFDNKSRWNALYAPTVTTLNTNSLTRLNQFSIQEAENGKQLAKNFIKNIQAKPF